MKAQPVVGAVSGEGADEEAGRGEMAEAGYLKRLFTKKGSSPYDELTWEMRDAVITNSKGEVVFKQENVEVPTGWSQQATNIVSSKYFRGALDTPERETSARQLVERVAHTIAGWGKEGGYFKYDE
ncbi:Class II vitamin B12-dependent ribonucleotide reductase [Candidatus Burarchaeum australiense]|nr:Class II vitamin B12-dependent ribonucleotide reductase [Candidatus Burarchaeum australiense]